MADNSVRLRNVVISETIILSHPFLPVNRSEPINIFSFSNPFECSLLLCLQQLHRVTIVERTHRYDWVSEVAAVIAIALPHWNRHGMGEGPVSLATFKGAWPTCPELYARDDKTKRPTKRDRRQGLRALARDF